MILKINQPAKKAFRQIENALDERIKNYPIK